jgi:hypothetical protein
MKTEDCSAIATTPDPIHSDGLEFEKVLVLSTAHIPLELRDRLERGRESGIICDPYDYGWRVWVPGPDYWHDTEDHDYPPELVAILAFAQSHGCGWVRFDSDGSEIDGFPSFED